MIIFQQKISLEVWTLKYTEKKSLKKSYKLDKTLLNKEHVTYFIRRSKLFKKKYLYPSLKQKVNFKLDLVVDEKQDLILIKKILNHFKKNIYFEYKELISFLKKNKKLIMINKNILRKGDT